MPVTWWAFDSVSRHDGAGEDDDGVVTMTEGGGEHGGSHDGAGDAGDAGDAGEENALERQMESSLSQRETGLEMETAPLSTK